MTRYEFYNHISQASVWLLCRRIICIVSLIHSVVSMLELLFSGSTGKYVSESGPGNKKLLAGDEVNGYFGPIPTNDLFTANDLINKFDLNAIGTIVDSPNLVWLKFVLNGKYLFFPTQALLNSLSWRSLYNAGLVYGVDGYGTITPSTGGVNQLSLINKAEGANDWIMKVRLPEVSTKPSIIWGGSGESEVEKSELGIMMGRIVTAYNWFDVTDKWDKLVVGIDFTTGNIVFSKTPYSDYQANSAINLQPTRLAYAAPLLDSAITTNCWMPVLELTSDAGVTIGADPVAQINYDKKGPALLIDHTAGSSDKLVSPLVLELHTTKPLRTTWSIGSDLLISPEIMIVTPSIKKLIL